MHKEIGVGVHKFISTEFLHIFHRVHWIIYHKNLDL